jgi:hypothetical protein
MLPDFGGDFFQLQSWKLRQLNIRRIDGTLIAPWQTYDELRPGTLVLIYATLHVYFFTERNSNIVSRKVRFIPSLPQIFSNCHQQVYQINGHDIKVLATSNLPAEEHHRPTLDRPKGKHRVDSSTPRKERPARAVFDSFSISPPQKRKT